MYIAITASPKRIFVTLSLLALLITVMGFLSIQGQHSWQSTAEWVSMFDLNTESNIPTWFSSMTLFIGGLLFFSLAHFDEIDRTKWLVLGGILTYISMDEASRLHERLDPIVREHLGISEGIFYFGWVVVAVPVILLFALIFARFFFRIDKSVRYIFLLAGIVYISGGLGMEMISGLYMSEHGIADKTYALLSLLEESLEISGAIILIYAQTKLLALRQNLAN